MFPQYTEIKPYDGRTAILLNSMTQEKVFLKTVFNYTTIHGVPYVIAIYRQLAGLGISPAILHSGMIDRVGYIISEYIPLTVRSAIQKQLLDKKIALETIDSLVQKIYRLQIYNLDVHSDNFLYDSNRQTIYMIDFDTVRLSPTKDDMNYEQRLLRDLSSK